MNLDIKGKIALVTRASAGLGKAIALSLAREGAKVAISGQRKEVLDETAMEIRNETEAKVLTFVGDMTQKENVTAFVNQVVDDWNTIMGDVRAECALPMQSLHERPPLQTPGV